MCELSWYAPKLIFLRKRICVSLFLGLANSVRGPLLPLLLLSFGITQIHLNAAAAATDCNSSQSSSSP